MNIESTQKKKINFINETARLGWQQVELSHR